MSEDMTAIIRTESESIASLNGQRVWITRAITKPDETVDEEALPLFRVVDQSGDKHTLCPEELRVADENEIAGQASNPMVHIGNKPVTNLHPFVYRTIEQMARESEPETINGTIYIAPGERSCRVYAIPYLMKPGQHPADIIALHQRDWTLAGQLDRDLEIVFLNPAFRDLAADIEGQMGGTIFEATWQAPAGDR